MNIAQILINAEENERQRSYAEEDKDKSELLSPSLSLFFACVCVSGEFRRQYILVLHTEIHRFIRRIVQEKRYSRRCI